MEVLEQDGFVGEVSVEVSHEQLAQRRSTRIRRIEQHHRRVVSTDEPGDCGSPFVRRVGTTVTRIRREPDQPIGLQRGERFVDVWTHGRSECLDHGGPQRMVGGAVHPTEATQGRRGKVAGASSGGIPAARSATMGP
jgi:hypothetical protein